MSVVSGVVVVCSLSDEDKIDLLDAELNGGRKPPVKVFARLEDHAGGNKHPQFILASAGLNYIDEDALADEFMAIDWDFPENAILVIQPEDGQTKVFRPDLGAA